MINTLRIIEIYRTAKVLLHQKLKSQKKSYQNNLSINKVILWIIKIHLKKRKIFAGFVHKFEEKMMKKSEKVTKYEIIGLFLFVAIPLPGTGAYSGSVIAALLGMRLKKAFPSIAAGVLVAGIIVTIITYGAGALVQLF